jgi:hypothetical protein
LSDQLDNSQRWHGAELSVTILGNWQYYRAKILKCGMLAFLGSQLPVLLLTVSSVAGAIPVL